MKPQIVAIVPMRHTSERVPGKNFRSFCGRPLFHRIVDVLLSCPEIETVMIDTDSNFILEDAARAYPSVVLYRRPEHLRDGMIAMNDVLTNSVAQLEADYYLQTHSTNPLLSSSTVSKAISTFLDGRPKYDSLFSVTRLQTRLWSANAKPINHNPSELLRTQDLDPVFEENSCMYLFSKVSLLKNKNRIGERPMLFEIDRLEAQDIDEEPDFTIAEVMFENAQHKGALKL